MQVLGAGQCVQQGKWRQIQLSYRERKPQVKQDDVCFIIVAVNLSISPTYRALPADPAFWKDFFNSTTAWGLDVYEQDWQESVTRIAKDQNNC